MSSRLSLRAANSPSLWVAGLISVLAASVVLLLQWPAAWVAPWLERITQGRVLLQEARGTLWNGSALLALGSGDSGTAIAWPQRIHWQLRPASLNQLSLGLRSSPDPGARPWVGALRWQPSGWRVEFDDIDWQLPSDWLSALGSPWNTIAPEGQLRLQSRQWRWQLDREQLTMGGQVTLTLHNLSTRLSSLRPLGDYQIKIMGGTTPSVELSTLQGSLQMNGKGLWHRGRLDFQGEAWANQADDEVVLSNLLGVLGPRRGTRALLKVG
jgi:general secretion pathway protein N